MAFYFLNNAVKTLRRFYLLSNSTSKRLNGHSLLPAREVSLRLK